jgi:DnaJ-class molecular chaperone
LSEQVAVVCGSCRGTGEVIAFVCGRPGGRIEETPCRDCQGKGSLDEKRVAEITAAARRRVDRLQRGLSVAQEAERLGIAPHVYARLERIS